MSLTDPTALLWGVLALPIAAFYLMKVRPRIVPIATNQFWDAVFAETRFRTAFRKLRDPISLLMQVAILALLVFAIAEPFVGGAKEDGRRMIIVIDDSAAMSATDVVPTRFARARAEVLQLIHRLGAYDDAAVVTTATRPRVACGLTGDRRILTQAVDAIEPADGPRHLADAIGLARRLLADHRRGRVVVVTDGAGGGLDGVSETDALELIAVGTRAGNVGITRFEARRSLADPIGYEVLIEIGNFSDEPVTFNLDVELDGTPVDRLPVEIAADGTWRGTLAKTSPAGGVLTAVIDRPDALAVDNRAWAVLPAREPLPVTLVTGGPPGLGSLFVEKVLEALPQVKTPLTVWVSEKSGPVANAPCTDNGVTVYYRSVPQTFPPGPVLFIDPIAPCDLWTPGEVATNPVLGTLDKTSPIVTNVALDRVPLGKVRALTFAQPPKLLATTDGGAAVIAAFEDRPAGRVLVLPIDLDGSDVPLRPVFPILAGNALQWLTRRGDDLRESVAAGATTILDLPAGAPLHLWGPDGKARPLPAVGGQITVGPLDRCGVWTARSESSTTGPATATVACNLSSPRDSDLRPTADVQGRPSRISSDRRLGGAPPWFLLAATAGVLLTVEWALYQRRWLN